MKYENVKTVLTEKIDTQSVNFLDFINSVGFFKKFDEDDCECINDGIFGDKGMIESLKDVFRSNSNMQEYLSTLGGLGLRERVLFLPRTMRKFKAWWNMHFDTKLLNPFWWGSTIGNIPGLQTVLAWKWSRLSNS